MLKKNIFVFYYNILYYLCIRKPKKKIMEADSINLVDKSENIYVRIKLSNNRKHWERWVSKDKRKWLLSEKMGTLEDVLKSQQELINRNYKNFFDVVTKK
jgi:hypothetical protein